MMIKMILMLAFYSAFISFGFSKWAPGDHTAQLNGTRFVKGEVK